MYFDSFAEFLAMGRHGLYVWLSYGAFLVILLWLLLDLARSRKNNLAKARRVWARAAMTTTEGSSE